MDEYDLTIMRRIDQIYTDISSSYGYRNMHQQLWEDGYGIGINKVNKLMNTMGIQALFPKKRKLTPPLKTMNIKFILTSYATLKSINPIKCGVEILPTSLSKGDFFIWLPLLIGIAVPSSHGKFPIPWMQR